MVHSGIEYEVDNHRICMKPMSQLSRLSIRSLMVLVLGVAVGFSVLRIPESRSTRSLGHVQSGRTHDALAMTSLHDSGWFLHHFEELLQEEGMTVSSDSSDMKQYLCCERTVYIGSDRITYRSAVGLSSVECRSIFEPFVSRGDF